MKKKLQQKENVGWTLITGGAKGLGAALSLGLAKQGYPVLVHYNTSGNEAEQLVIECRKMGAKADLIFGNFATPSSTKTFIKKCQKDFPNLKNIINNVGNYLVKPCSETSYEEWADLFQTNLNVPFALIQAFLESIKSLQGNIINIGSVGFTTVKARSPVYSMTKLSLNMLTKTLAKELAKHKVRVNMISPGCLENSVDVPSNMKEIPMGRLGRLEEVVRVVLFLLEKENGYVTGQNIEVGGGLGL